MAYFAVAHLPFRKADVRAGSMHQRVRIIAQQRIVGWFARGGDRVAFRGRRESPTVQDGQQQRFLFALHY
jgi:hypothetical protein